MMSLLFAAMISGCSSLGMRDMTRQRCSSQLATTAEKLENGSLTYEDLASLKIGESGFFYILSNDGILLLHPHGALAGSDFSSIPSVKVMMSKEEGVQADEMGGVSRTVFFRRLSSGNILCLTVDTEELKGE